MNKTAAFIMPVKLTGAEVELQNFKEAVDSVKNQTDKDWILVMIDDYSDNKAVYDMIDTFKKDLKDKLQVIYSDKNYGSGAARNTAVRYAYETGAPFILFNDSDDISDPRRLELVRKAFEDETVNVVYTSFDVIDEYGNLTPPERITLSVREIIEGHKVDIVEGEKAWISIAEKKKYTNLTSCTAVRTSLAIEEPFPALSVSEDSHTWFRYGAHPGKFVFLKDIKGGYRICSGVKSRSRSVNTDFYKKMYETDSDGFEKAIEIAKRLGTMGDRDENEIRAAFHVRIALTLLHGDCEEYCKKSLEIAYRILGEKTFGYIDRLHCEPESKAIMKALIS